MLSLLGVLLVPVLVGVVAFFLSKREDSRWDRITLREFVLMEVIAAGVATGGFFYVRHRAIEDIEHWNGAIVDKTSGSESCCHCSQSCDTCTDSEGRTSSCNCHEECDHNVDYWWGLTLSTGDKLTIDDCEPNPNAVPAAWANARMLEPASAKHTYTNYLKADPDSVLRRGARAEYLQEIPPFPRIHDFYKVEKVVTHGVRVPPEWNQGLQKLNSYISDKKQVDIIMVFTRRDDPAWADALEAEWLYGPKNALIIVAGVPDGKTMAWVRVVTISRVADLKVSLRDGLTGKSLADHQAGLALIRREIEGKFERTPLAEYEYLMSAASPPWPWLLGLYTVTALFTSALALVFHKKDVL